MRKLWDKLRNLGHTTFERRMRVMGFYPGAETNNFRLWFNDEDEMIVEHKKGAKL
ncbi:hypothetical protein [Selenomonas sp. AB3002]|uniref:hypothetical protein n=1 Tax=Selenomonas sp. AB3002 TaxID=1392502 RepID=UPI00163AFBFE